MITRRRIAILVLVLIFGVFDGCRRADTYHRKVVSIGLSKEIPTLDPAISYDTVSADVIYQAYETLYEYHYLKRPYTLQPLLAEGMPEVSKDGLTYTIHLKKGVRYHDDPCFKKGERTVKAQDFIDAFKRLAFIPTESTGLWPFEGKIRGIDDYRRVAGKDFSKFYSTPILGLRTPDDHTLVIELNRPHPQLIYALAMTFTSPIPREAIDYYKNDLSKHIIGTGPFFLDRWDGGLSLSLKQFKFYRKTFYPSVGDRFANENDLLRDAGKELPFIDGIDYRVLKDPTERWNEFLAKKIDFLVLEKDNFPSAVNLNGELLPELKRRDIVAQTAPALTFSYIGIAMDDSVLGKNRNLRLAIAHAINYQKYIELFTNNLAQKANSIYPPGVPGYTPSARLPYETDLAKARLFLRKAGFPNGKGLPELPFDVRGDNATVRKMGEFIQGELAQIGIRVRIIENTFPEYLKKSRTGKLRFWQSAWTLDYPDAENILQLLITKNIGNEGPNSTRHSNKEFDRLFDILSTLDNGDEKFELMSQMENIINTDLPWIMQYYSRNYIVHHRYLKNYRNSDIICNGHKYLRIAEN